MSEIARRLSIVKSTALGILKALEEEGFVVQDSIDEEIPGGKRALSILEGGLEEHGASHRGEALPSKARRDTWMKR